MRKYFFISLFLIASMRLPARDYPASLFGISSDGVTLNTRSIQFAIDYIHDHGGGRLVFDVGRFLTGTIHLRSDVILHLQEGAVLMGVLNPFDYDRDNFTALILARGQERIGITGKGMIEGQGRQVARNVADLVHKGLIKDAFRNDRPEVEIRPMLIYFRECTDVTIKGINLRNGAAWIQTYDQCRNLAIDSITVDSRAFWNNDGIDVVDCDSVVISNSYIDSDDDGICLKSHDANRICRNVWIRNCTIRSSANGIKFGTASRGGFMHISLVNNKVFDTYRSAVALEAVDGGILEDVYIDSLQATHTGHAVFLRIGERVPGKKGSLKNITVKNLVAVIAAGKADSGYEYEGPVEDLPRNISPAIVIAGLPGNPIEDIHFDNIIISHPGGGNPNYAHVGLNELDSVPEKPTAYPEFSMFRELPAWGVYIRHAGKIGFNRLSLSKERKDYRVPIVLDDVHQSVFTRLDVPGKPKDAIYEFRCSEIRHD